MSEYNIRPLRASDLTPFRTEPLYSLLKALSPENIVEGEKAGMKQRLRKTFRSENSRNLLLAAYCNRMLVGTGAFYSVPFGPQWEYWIKDLIVEKAHRRNGLAKEILSKLLRHASGVAKRQKTKIRVRVRCRPDQTHAESLFRSMGFEDKSVPVKHKNNRVKKDSELILYKEIDP